MLKILMFRASETIDFCSITTILDMLANDAHSSLCKNTFNTLNGWRIGNG